ncbi:MAG: hypothetical protein II625_03785 [Bacilli bacterium]|nr:hypothetical protein [Bacilli bacterium]
MTTKIDYADAHRILYEFYQQRYVGHTVSFSIEDQTTVRYDSDGDAYKVTEKVGKLVISKPIKGLENHVLSFEQTIPNLEMRKILLELLNVIFADENLSVSGIVFKSNQIDLAVNEIDVKKLTLNRGTK